MNTSHPIAVPASGGMTSLEDAEGASVVDFYLECVTERGLSRDDVTGLEIARAAEVVDLISPHTPRVSYEEAIETVKVVNKGARKVAAFTVVELGEGPYHDTSVKAGNSRSRRNPFVAGLSRTFAIFAPRHRPSSAEDIVDRALDRFERAIEAAEKRGQR